MEYVFRFLFACAVTFVGCEISIFATRQRIRQCKLELKTLREKLTKPESYVWVNVHDRLPVSPGYYLIEYAFTEFPNSRYAAVHRFDAELNRFRNVDPFELKVLRWAELPK